MASVPRPWCCRGRALAGVDGEGRAARRPGSAPGASRPPPRPPRPCGGRWGGSQAAETQAFPAGPRSLQTPAVWEPVWLSLWQRRPPRPDDTASSSGSLVGPEPVFFHASPVSAAQWEAGAGTAWGCLPTGPASPGGADRRGADSPRRRGGTWLNRAHRPRGPSAPQGPPRGRHQAPPSGSSRRRGRPWTPGRQADLGPRAAWAPFVYPTAPPTPRLQKGANQGSRLAGPRGHGARRTSGLGEAPAWHRPASSRSTGDHGGHASRRHSTGLTPCSRARHCPSPGTPAAPADPHGADVAAVSVTSWARSPGRTCV